MLLLEWWYVMIYNSISNACIWYNSKNILSFLYVFTNIYRSTFPVMHYTNTCMFSICSLFLDRFLSTISELAFSVLLINWFNRKYIYIAVSLIGLAEIFCWLGIITGFSYWHMLEESLWAIFAIFLYCLNIVSDRTPREKTIAGILLNIYIVYMICYDVPSYYYRPNSSKKKLLRTEHISKDIDEWYTSLIWMTGYFTFGSWISLAIS